MRIIVSGAAAITAAVLLVTGCNSDDPRTTGGSSGRTASRTASKPLNLSTQTPSDGVMRITVAELKAAYDKDEVFIVDVRTPQDYAITHIKGSVNIPEGSTESQISQFPRNRMIVTYCS